MKNQVAKFWKYTGNHHNGKDCDRQDPHGFGLKLISYVAYCGDEGECQDPLTYADTKLIKVTHHKGDDFGHEVTVSAPPDVWERARQSLPKVQAAL